MTVLGMKQQKTDAGRGKHRKVKSVSFPKDLEGAIQAYADKHHNGDFTRALIVKLAKEHKEARDFLKNNPTEKHNPKKT